eukprot:PITA_14692
MEPRLKFSAQLASPLVDETLFRQLMGNLVYLTATRPDISFAVSYISRFMSAPKVDHWIAVKRVLHYVCGTPDYGLLYTRSSDPILSGYTDSDWAGSADDCKSIVGYVFSLGFGAVTWTSPTPLFCDNQGVLKLAKNPVFHERTKHVETHCHYIRQPVEDGSVQLRYVLTTEQPVDIFTKLLGLDKFVKFRGSIGVVNRLSIKGGY